MLQNKGNRPSGTSPCLHAPLRNSHSGTECTQPHIEAAKECRRKLGEERQGSLGRHCCVHFSMNFRYASWPQAHSRPWTNDKSTIDAVAGDLRSNSYSPFLRSHGRLVSNTRVALFKHGSDGIHGLRVAFLDDSRAGPLNDRTAQSFPGRQETFHASQSDMKRSATC